MGSLRVPAHYCGVRAHKPTLGLLPFRGHTPPGAPALPRESDRDVVGPMARSASDLALALDVIAGPDEVSGGIAYRLALPAPWHEELKSFRALVIDTHPLLQTATSVRTALDDLAQRLRRGHRRAEHDVAFAEDLPPSVLNLRLPHSRTV